jgi:hypothetical protein
MILQCVLLQVPHDFFLNHSWCFSRELELLVLCIAMNATVEVGKPECINNVVLSLTKAMLTVILHVLLELVWCYVEAGNCCCCSLFSHACSLLPLSLAICHSALLLLAVCQALLPVLLALLGSLSLTLGCHTLVDAVF